METKVYSLNLKSLQYVPKSGCYKWNVSCSINNKYKIYYGKNETKKNKNPG